MIAIVAVCAVLLQNPTDVESTTQPSENVAMSAYEVEQIIWWNYYGEWARVDAVAEPSTSKPDATSDNEAFRKSSTK